MCLSVIAREENQHVRYVSLRRDFGRNVYKVLEELEKTEGRKALLRCQGTATVSGRGAQRTILPLRLVEPSASGPLKPQPEAVSRSSCLCI